MAPTGSRRGTHSSTLSSSSSAMSTASSTGSRKKSVVERARKLSSGSNMSTGSTPDTRDEWSFAQSFGTDGFCEEDIFTAVQFDQTGGMIALGDKAGRITVFEATHKGPLPVGARIAYAFHSEFQSHEPEFDRLHSVDVEATVNRIRWCSGRTSAKLMLATNDACVKLWKISSRPPPRADYLQPGEEAGSSLIGTDGGIVMPQRTPKKKYVPMATCKREFHHTGGASHIHSLSTCSDGETFLTASPLGLTMWNMEVSHECQELLNIRPPNIEDLTEVITAASYSSVDANILAYAMSSAKTRLVDLREASCLTGQSGVEFAAPVPSVELGEVVASISDVTFSPCGQRLITRDYLTTRVWDVRNSSKPLHAFPVHAYLGSFLSELHDNDCIMDKFAVCASPDGSRIATGSYDSTFVVHRTDDAVQEDRNTLTIQATSHTTRKARGKHAAPDRYRYSRLTRGKEIRVRVARMDFAKKSLNMAWHPTTDAIAVASLNKVYVYQQRSKA